MCFDKTGTLTEEGLDLYGIRPLKKRLNNTFKFEALIVNFNEIPLEFEKIMASCHGLTIVNDVIIGDPLEIKMFECVGWSLTEGEKTELTKLDKKISILKRFDFSSTL